MILSIITINYNNLEGLKRTYDRVENIKIKNKVAITLIQGKVSG